MAISKINTRALANDSVTTDKVADNAITTDMVASGEIGVTDLADGSITNAKISATAAIAPSKIDMASVAALTMSGHLSGNTATFTGDVAINNGSPELYFGTTGVHYNWMLAAQENLDQAFEISVGSQDTDYSNDTYSKVVTVKADGNMDLVTGGLKVGGTTAIDSSRNATFAGITSTANIVASGGQHVLNGYTNTTKGALSVKANTSHWNISLEENNGAETWQLGVDVDGDLNFHNSGDTSPSFTFNDSGAFQIGGTTVINSSKVGFLNEKTRIGTGATYPTDNAQLFIQRANNNPYIGFFSSDGSRNAYLQSVGSGAFYINNGEGGGWAFNNSTSDVLSISDSGGITATGLTVDNGSSGQSKITISEGGADNRNLVLYSAASGASAKIAVEGTTADLDFVVNNGSQTAMTIDGATGNVGIGDTGPTSLLSIKKDSTRTTDYENMLKITHTSSGTTGVGFGSAIYFLGERENGALQGMGRLVFDAEVNSGTDISSGFSVQTATAGTPSEKLRVTHDGNVGIGIQNPPKALTVFRANQTDDTTVALLKLHAQFADSSIEQTDKVAIQFAVQNSGGGIQTSDAIKFSYNNNLYLMEDGGDVAIGNVSDPSARLDISAASSTAFGAQALKVRDGSHTTIQMDSGAADGRIQVGAAGTLRGVYKAQHAGTQTDHPFSLIQDNSSRLTIRDDRSVAHIDSGYRFDLGFFPAPSNTYQHFKTDCQKSNHMLFFEYKGYSYSSGGAVLTAMTVYAYTGTSGPYDPLYTRYGHNTANGFVNCYYSSDGYLVLVLKTNHTNGYTGGWMWAQSGNNFTDSNIRMLAQTSTSSNSGAY